MDRFFDIINTPIAVLDVLFVVVAVNLFLYFGYYSPKTPTPLPAEHTSPSTTTEPSATVALPPLPLRSPREHPECPSEVSCSFAPRREHSALFLPYSP
jgi:hypothetical protein